MLLSQARIAPGGSDILDTQIPSGNAGQGKARPQYLPPSLAGAAIDEYRFHITLLQIRAFAPCNALIYFWARQHKIDQLIEVGGRQAKA